MSINNQRLIPEKNKLRNQITQLKEAETTINKALASCRVIAEEYGDKNDLNTISSLRDLVSNLEDTLKSILFKDHMEN